MMKATLLALFLAVAVSDACSQKFRTSAGMARFFSDAAIEDIEAVNNKVSAIVNISTGEFAFSATIREFQFEKALMKEHFNEKYMESDKFPVSTFTGSIAGFNKEQAGWQEVAASGKFTIHGVTREVQIPGTISKSDNGYSIKAKFIVRLEDYKVKIPQLLWQNIAEQVEVTVEFSLIEK